MSEEGLAVPGDTLPRKLSFIFFSVLIAANLILVSIILASPKSLAINSTQLTNIADNLQPTTERMYREMRTFRRSFSPVRGISSFGSAVGHDTASFASSTGTVIAHLGRDMGDGLGAVFIGTVHVSRSAARATSLSAIIRPADYTHVPVITPIAATSATIASHVAAPPIVQQHVAVQPTAPINIASVTPLPQVDTADTYAWGNCTWWVSERRAETNDPIPNSWGNAATWAERAAQDGYIVDHHPTPGAIMQTPDSAGGLGHVAFVERVDSNGTWHISEMNVLGLDVVDHRSEAPTAAASYNFIHDKV